MKEASNQRGEEPAEDYQEPATPSYPKRKGETTKTKKKFQCRRTSQFAVYHPGGQSSSRGCWTDTAPHRSTKLYEAAGQGNCVLRLFRKGKLNAQHSTRVLSPTQPTPTLLEDLPLANRCSWPEHGKEENFERLRSMLHQRPPTPQASEQPATATATGVPRTFPARLTAESTQETGRGLHSRRLSGQSSRIT